MWAVWRQRSGRRPRSASRLRSVSRSPPSERPFSRTFRTRSRRSPGNTAPSGRFAPRAIPTRFASSSRAIHGPARLDSPARASLYSLMVAKNPTAKKPPAKAQSSGAIDALLDEKRVYPPPKEFRDKAAVRDESIYKQAATDFEGFWAKVAGELDWFVAWDRVLEWNPPDAKWFVGGKLNASYNCLDRHVRGARKNKAALVWVGEPGDRRTLTYWDLYREVNKFANALRKLGVARGDRVAIYMPMVPEAAVAMLACARIGAVHSVVFGGFSAQSVADRIKDSQAKLVITADGGFRRGAVVPLKQNVDEGLTLKDADGDLLAKSIEKVIVLRRAGNQVQFREGRDLWWHEEIALVEVDCPAEKMDSEAPLFILYTSGSTGKPKGILHTTGGYLLFAKLTTKYIFDVRDEDVYWCTADVGWVTGHSYVVYGPLANGATSLMYEGAPNFPEPDRFWRIVEKYGVTILYTAPTAIRAFMKWGVDWPKKHNLTSLRLLGSVG